MVKSPHDPAYVRALALIREWPDPNVENVYPALAAYGLDCLDSEELHLLLAMEVHELIWDFEIGQMWMLHWWWLGSRV